MDNPWTSLNRVHVTVVGESFDTAQVRLKAIGQGGTGRTPKCVNVKGTVKLYSNFNNLTQLNIVIAYLVWKFLLVFGRLLFRIS